MKKTKLFNILAIILISIFSISIVVKTFQNDTFYTIKIGQSILKNGIDMIDHFSFHNLNYTYPHWLYDVIIYLAYAIGGFKGVYISTVIFTIILGVILYYTNYKQNKHRILCLLLTILTLFFLQNFLTARAQLVTYSLFILEIYFIEKLLETNSNKYVIYLFIVAVLICNVHVAVFPFFFILFLPYFAEAFVRKIVKKENFDKIIISKENNIKKLLITFMICIFSGLFTPLGVVPYTYFIKTYMGNSMHYISEHQPLVLIKHQYAIIYIFLMVVLLVIRKSKIKLRDLFMIIGMFFMMFLSTRHQSLTFIILLPIITRLICSIYEENIEKIEEFFINKLSKKNLFKITLISLLVCIPIFLDNYTNVYVDKHAYPTKAVKYIKKNLDINNLRLYNQYNFGSYLLFNDIPVFIDSRADLYSKEFNKGITIHDDFYKLSTVKVYYEDIFKKYKINYCLTNKDDKLDILLSHNNNYNLVYSDDNFVLYKVNIEY